MSGNEDGNGNRTVFRPSPLQGLNQPQSAPDPPPHKGWGQPPAPAPPPAPAVGWGAPANAPPPFAQWDMAQAPPAATPAWGEPVSPGMGAAARLSADDIPPPNQPQLVRNRLMLEAGPILAFAASIRCGRARAPLLQFHAQATAAIAAFDRVIAPLFPEEMRQRAKYAVCATLDDIVQNLPGAQSEVAQWARSSMVVQSFQENIGGDRFWQLVESMLARPAQHRELIELYHACLAAGFEGRFRNEPDGKRRLQEIMRQLQAALDHSRAISTQVLVPQWQGIDAPRAKVGFLSYIALAAAIAAGILLVVYIALRLVLMGSGEASWNAVSTLNPPERLTLARNGTPLPAGPVGPQSTRLKQFLADEIRQKLVVVEEDATTVRIRTTVGQLFGSASDQLEPGREALFHKIGKALEGEKGKITVEGHSDSDRIARLEFPDNLALSGARANTVAKLIAQDLTDGSRIEAQAFGDSRPIASNDSADGKSQNRRVEIVIPRQN